MPKYTVTITDGICPGSEAVALLAADGARMAVFKRADGVLSAEIEMNANVALGLARDGYSVTEMFSALPPSPKRKRRVSATAETAPDRNLDTGASAPEAGDDESPEGSL